jgi:hypothetical protein
MDLCACVNEYCGTHPPDPDTPDYRKRVVFGLYFYTYCGDDSNKLRQSCRPRDLGCGSTVRTKEIANF